MESNPVDGVNENNDGVIENPEKNDSAFMALKAEKKAAAEKAAKLESELNEMKRKEKEKEQESLKQQGEYKRLFEEEQKAKAEIEEKLKIKERKELNLRKIDVVMREIGTPLAKPEYWNFVDLDRIPVDEATNDIDVNIAKQVANDFLRDYPELTLKKTGRMDDSAPASTKKLTREEWLRLPLNEKKKRMREVLNK